jgi:hypothetical protein
MLLVFLDDPLLIPRSVFFNVFYEVVLYGGCGIGMAFMAMNLGGTVLQVIYI